MRAMHFTKIVPAALGLAFMACSQEVAEPMPEPEPVTEAAPPAPPPPAPAPAPTPPPEPEQPTAQASYMRDTRWVEGSEGNLLLGLNGGEYPPYAASFVKEVQRFLFEHDFYEGPVTGVLDEQTMEAIGEFQGENGIVQSGVPSPETRDAMRASEAT